MTRNHIEKMYIITSCIIKPDIKKLPSSVEEFRKQYKMDKKAEQERLAEQSQ